MMPKPVQLDDIIRTIHTLVECESPSADLDAVRASANLVADLGESILGVAAERIEVGGVSHLRWSFGGPTRVLLLAHHDTVWPLGAIDRLPYAVSDGVLTGPGCFDMKTGLAMAMHAIAALEDRDGVTLRRWTLVRAWPVKFVAGEWDNESDENVIESVTLTYDFFELV